MNKEHTRARYQKQLNDENALLLSILDGTSSETGEAFFRALVRELAKVLVETGIFSSSCLIVVAVPKSMM